MVTFSGQLVTNASAMLVSLWMLTVFAKLATLDVQLAVLQPTIAQDARVLPPWLEITACAMALSTWITMDSAKAATLHAQLAVDLVQISVTAAHQHSLFLEETHASAVVTHSTTLEVTTVNLATILVSAVLDLEAVNVLAARTMDLSTMEFVLVTTAFGEMEMETVNLVTTAAQHARVQTKTNAQTARTTLLW